LETLAAAP
jgi:hypothetical protein